jgi:hypothetical protein
MTKTGEKAEIVILVATSGDTGKAALEGFRDVDRTRIVVFFPHEGVSEMQRLQMVTQEGGNVAVVAVRGNFDDTQTGVKKIFADRAANDALAAELREHVAKVIGPIAKPKFLMFTPDLPKTRSGIAASVPGQTAQYLGLFPIGDGVKEELHFGHSHRLASLRTREDDVGGFGRPKHSGVLLSKHPSQRIGQIRLAASVGTNDGCDPGTESDFSSIAERLEAVE